MYIEINIFKISFPQCTLLEDKEHCSDSEIQDHFHIQMYNFYK